MREKCPYSELFGSVLYRIQSKCEKILTRITPNRDNFFAVSMKIKKRYKLLKKQQNSEKPTNAVVGRKFKKV